LLSTKSEGEGEIENFRRRAQSIYNITSTLLSTFYPLHPHPKDLFDDNKMASIYDKLAQAKYEEKLKATIISEL